jgi:histidinol-phosphate aminotransferase
MYSVSAQVNDVSIVQVPLDVDPTAPKSAFGLDVPAILDTLDREPHIKVAYFCSPGNPTGALLAKEDIRAILEHSTWNGIVVVDEAYVDFAGEGASLAEWVTQWPNLLVMQTLSKTFGMAGIRIGVAFTSPPIARLLNNIKAPYNISSPTSILATHALSEASRKVMHENRKRILKQRDRLLEELPRIPGVGRRRGGTDANFLLFEMVDANENPDNVTALAVYEGLARTKGVVVRFRGKEHGCLGCLRFTVGTEEEVTRLLSALRKSLEEVRLRTSIAPKDEEKAEVEANRVVA